jgi:glyoxylase I family protein
MSVVQIDEFDIKVGGVHHIALWVGDVERVAAFYREVLALPELRRWYDADGRLRSIWVSLTSQPQDEGAAFLAIEKAIEPTIEPAIEQASVAGAQGRAPYGWAHAERSPAGWHLIALQIEVATRELWRQRLLTAGHPVERESDYSLYLRDPELNWVALSHYPVAGVKP